MNSLNKKISAKYFITGVVLIFVLILVISFIYFAKVSSDLANTGVSPQVITTSIVKGDTAEIKYFSTSTNSNIQARYQKGNTDTASFLLNEIETFKNDVGENEYNKEKTTDFIATYSTATSPTTDSVILKIYRNTGGAHGNQYYKVFNYDKNKILVSEQSILNRYDMNKIVSLVEVDLKNKYHSIIENKLDVKEFYNTEEGKSALKWIKEGSVATSTNYSTIWPDDESLIIYISQYQAWAYAYGDALVKIPVKNILK